MKPTALDFSQPSIRQTFTHHFMDMVTDQSFISSWYTRSDTKEAILFIQSRLAQNLMGFGNDELYELAWHLHQKINATAHAFCLNGRDG